MRSNGEINRVRSRPVPGRKGPGRPTKTWEECVKQDLKVCGLSEAGTQDRLSWRSSVKNSRQEPTPSNGSLPQSMAAPPARRVLGMRTRSFNKTGFDWLIDIYIFFHYVSIAPVFPEYLTLKIQSGRSGNTCGSIQAGTKTSHEKKIVTVNSRWAQCEQSRWPFFFSWDKVSPSKPRWLNDDISQWPIYVLLSLNIITLYVLIFSKETWTCIYNLYNFSPVSGHKQLKSCLI